MLVLIKGFLADEAGGAALEYAILAALLSIMVSGGFSAATAKIAGKGAMLNSVFDQGQFAIPKFQLRD